MAPYSTFLLLLLPQLFLRWFVVVADAVRLSFHRNEFQLICSTDKSTKLRIHFNWFQHMSQGKIKVWCIRVCHWFWLFFRSVVVVVVCCSERRTLARTAYTSEEYYICDNMNSKIVINKQFQLIAWFQCVRVSDQTTSYSFVMHNNYLLSVIDTVVHSLHLIFGIWPFSSLSV